MDQTEANIQMAKDIHMITWPVRHILKLLVITLFILAFPLLLLVTVLALPFVDPRSVFLLKFVYGLAGPFLFTAWFAVGVGYMERKRDGCKATDLKWANLRGGLALVGSFFGVFAAVMINIIWGIEGVRSFILLLIGLFSPALLYGIKLIICDPPSSNPDPEPKPKPKSKLFVVPTKNQWGLYPGEKLASRPKDTIVDGMPIQEWDKLQGFERDYY